MGLADGVAWEREFGSPKKYICSLCKREGVCCSDISYTVPKKCKEGREHTNWKEESK